MGEYFNGNAKRRRADKGNGVTTIFSGAQLSSVDIDYAAAAHDCVTGAGEYVVGEVVSGGGTAWEVMSMAVVMKMAGRGRPWSTIL